jgi:Flp pilus assembly protein TadD
MNVRKILTYGAPLLVLAVLACGLWTRPWVQQPTANELAEVAITHFKAKQPEQAREAFRKALELDPKNHRAHYGAGHLALREKKFDVAERHLRAAYEAKPNDVDTILTLGTVYQRGGDLKQAEMIYQAVRKVDPKNSEAVYNMGMLEIDRKNYPKSKSHFEEYLQLAPKAPDRKRVLQRIRLLEAHIKERQGK